MLLEDFDGRPFDLDDLRGRKVVLVVWASYSGCRFDSGLAKTHWWSKIIVDRWTESLYRPHGPYSPLVSGATRWT